MSTAVAHDVAAAVIDAEVSGESRPRIGRPYMTARESAEEMAQPRPVELGQIVFVFARLGGTREGGLLDQVDGENFEPLPTELAV